MLSCLAALTTDHMASRSASCACMPCSSDASPRLVLDLPALLACTIPAEALLLQLALPKPLYLLCLALPLVSYHGNFNWLDQNQFATGVI